MCVWEAFPPVLLFAFILVGGGLSVASWIGNGKSFHALRRSQGGVFSVQVRYSLHKAKVKLLSCSRLFATPWTIAFYRLLRPWDFPSKSTRVGCHFLLQGIFPTQGSKPGLAHCRQTLYPLSHQGSHSLYIHTTKDNACQFYFLC